MQTITQSTAAVLTNDSEVKDPARFRLSLKQIQERAELLACYDESSPADQKLLRDFARIHRDRNQKGK